MASFSHPLLGSLEFKDGVADTVLRVGDEEYELDLWFEEEVDHLLVDQVASLVARAAELRDASFAAVRANLASGDPDAAAVLHRSFHLEEFDPSQLLQVFGTSIKAEIDDEIYLAGLRLRRVGAYPDALAPYLIWDFGLAGDLSDHLVCVLVDFSGRVIGVEMES